MFYSYYRCQNKITSCSYFGEIDGFFLMFLHFFFFFFFFFLGVILYSGAVVNPSGKSNFGTSFSINFSIIFGHRFLDDLGGHFRHFWPPRSAKLGPKRVLKAYQHQKREFSPNTTPADTAAIFGAPRCRPKCPKIGPRRLQEALEEHFFRFSKFS